MSTPVEILLVEDNPADVRLTLHALEQHHLANRIEVVNDGAEALEFIFGMGRYSDRTPAEAPKVILLDLKVPKVDGLEVLRRLKADLRTRTIPVVVLTSSREDRDVKMAYKLGANSYLVKPVDFEKFSEAIQQFGMYWVLLNRRPDLSNPLRA